ncbi:MULTISPECIES: type I polyketide synthase [unclassified Crossiella]|uniref:type I polyketide synthase n=1 Tax=unclassified Crossiella TaxID=2620835 RepID=UPI001FFF5344|nr:MULTISPECIES: type I polyketide synthase [unclassified Crossiella]MCK2241767.1 SDR family NAD(P)-dependent oxidoreductase [Crossiella sp. S99.2]MCK2255361.1 SDR family NAD(P)-dependent oxidoreductase [Crossiella sp. S99.1]
MDNEQKLRDYLKRASADLQRTRRRLHELEAASHEPIAIIGMACRYPGDITSPEDLWRLVESASDGVGSLPADRGWYLDEGGSASPISGGFLYDAPMFDPEFFGISPREALAMDPQQRLLLEVSWEAMERSGLDPLTLKGSSTGVFVGAIPQDYRLGPRDNVGGYALTGTTSSVLSGRLAYVFGLVGPTLTVDTACSTSLVTLHLAARALRAGECSLALAGGVTVMSSPGTITEFNKQGGLAADGYCRSFSDDADGTGWSEGVGVLMLERLSDARRNGHRILAVVSGSAVNSDGASNGLTAPNGPSQQRVIEAALQDARLAPRQVDVVEAHGTGTALGDPVEAEALLAVYGRDRERPLLLGSIKSNLGHTQSAAGVAGVIKMVQAMRHGLAPQTLHVRRPTDQVDWTVGRVELLTEATPWPETGEPRRAGVSSFGLSGTNAHVILELEPEEEQATEPKPEPKPDPKTWPVPLLVAGRTADALRAQATNLVARLDTEPGLNTTDLAYSLAVARSPFEHRAALVVADLDAARAALAELAEGAAVGSVVHERPKLAVLFAGQGSQRLAMGRELHGRFPVFAETFDAVLAEFDPLLDTPLREIVWGEDAEALARTGFAQPAIFAVEVALFRLLESWGVSPDFLAGHSVGEIAAAHLAGVFTLTEAATLVAARARLMQALPTGGAMVAVDATEAEIRPLLTGREAQVTLAAVNGPRHVVLSGDEDAVTEIAAGFAEQGRRTRRLHVSHAFHSPHMDPAVAEFQRVVEGLSPQPPRIPVVSTVTGAQATVAELTSAEYWAGQIRATVRFADAVSWLHEHGVRAFLELGPDTTLGTLTESSLATADPAPAITSVLRPDRGEVEAITTALTVLHGSGVALRWAAYFDGLAATEVDLPTYPFQRRRFWPRDGYRADVGSVRSAGLSAARHPLLAATVSLAGSEGTLLTGRLAVRDHPWLAGHRVGTDVVLPGAALIELVTRAADEVGCDSIRELTTTTALRLPGDGGVQLQLQIGPDEDGRREVAVYSRPDDQDDLPWTKHATAILERGAVEAIAGEAEWPPAGAEPVDVSGLYVGMGDGGVHYGPSFQGLRAAWKLGTEVFAEVELPAEVAGDAAEFGLHPVLLDSALHAAHLAELDASVRGGLPFHWEDVRLHAAGASAARVRLTPAGDRISLTISDHTGALIAAVGAVVLRTPSGSAPVATGNLYRLAWTESGEAPITPARIGLLGPDHFGLAALLELPVAADLDTLAEGEMPTVVLHQTWTEESPRPGAHELTASALARLRDWLEDSRFPGTELIFVTRGATGAVTDPAAAAVWGLVRTAQAEHPGRFRLLDLDPAATVTAELVRTALAGSEPQLALQDNKILAARLARAIPAEEAPAAWDENGTVVITGGLSGLGSVLARHLVTARGVRSLLLLSRSGLATAGAENLVAELTELGALVTVAACDVADRDSLSQALHQVPAEHPITAVCHSAGVLADGVISTLTAEQLTAALRPKVDGAWHLHDLIGDTAALVLFSSLAGLLGAPGQGNYAAGNAFLDALTAHRRTLGLPGVSLAWGPWAETAGMTAELGGAQVQRLRRLGTPPLSESDGLALFDLARTAGEPVLAPVRLDFGVLRSAPEVPSVLRGLLGQTRRRVTAGPLGGQRPKQHAVLGKREATDLVSQQIAAVLGHTDSATIDPGRPLAELGFDSLTAVELRNRLSAATGLRLSPTLVFDHPNLGELVEHILRESGSVSGPVAVSAVPYGAVSDDPIVIVGMGCRYPGGVSSPDDLWGLLAEGRDAITGFPDNRGWDLATLYHPDPDHPGTAYTRSGGFLRDAGQFDPAFFGMGPREALATDAQQRLLLEVSWEAIERAGIDPRRLRGSRTGVFAGVMYGDYGALLAGADFEGHAGTGTSGSIVSGRVSYALGLEGPAVTVDTACSSSLVAMHWAMQALRSGECTLALAGGVTVMATPGAFIEFSRQRGLAKDGRCKAYSDSADGVSWAEGVGVVVLERQSDAIRNGHQILAVVRGSAVNSDGSSNGLTAPNGGAQQRVIRDALAGAGLSTSDVDVIEGHGTGTALGDPVEARALLATYGQDRTEPVLLGSVKSNIGHTQAAAGVAGIIKMVLAMRHGQVPKTLHVDTPSSHVDWAEGALSLLAEPTVWPEADRPRRAAVSSFGFSGTNAHVILEAPPAPAAREITAEPEIIAPVLLSARSATALRRQASRLAPQVTETTRLTDLAYSLAATRSRFEHRAVLTAADPAALRKALAALADGGPSPAVATGEASPNLRLTALFTGQGSQRPGMGAELRQRFPVFATALEEVFAAVDPHLDRPLAEVMFAADAELLDRTEWTQPAVFALEVALHRLLESWGVRPDFLIGHSIGELAAAHVAGVFSLADAAKLVVARGRLMQALRQDGAMVAVQATEEEVRPELTDGVVISAVNGPRSVVLGGDEEATLAVAAHFAEQGRRTRRLNTSHAFHTPHMDGMLTEFLAVAGEVDYQPPTIPIVSTVTGQLVEDTELCSPEYWAGQVRATVRFADAVRTAARLGVGAFVEIGPDSVLCAMAAETLGESADIEPVPALRAKREEERTLVEALGRLHIQGVDVDWDAFFGPGRTVLDLPTYAFDHQLFWPRASTPVARPAELRYRADWAALGSVAVPQLSGLWLLVDVADELAATLESHGAQVRQLALDATLPTRLAELDQDVAGVLSGQPLIGTHNLLRALVAAGVDAPLWTVTRQAVCTGTDDLPPNPDQATVWGYGRAAALEFPAGWGGLIDLAEDANPGDLVRALGAAWPGEDQLALRAAGAYGRRLVRHEGAELTAELPTEGTVLITGGTGGLGGEVARWLATAGVRHLVLTSRKGPDAPGARTLAAELAELGATVDFRACDAADRDALAAVLDAVPAEHPLIGVVHAAGVSELRPIVDTDPAELSASMAAKVLGAANLDALLAEADLDLFVLFGSIAGVVGSGGQAAYSAANAYLDALAENRRARGFNATSLGWGPWAEAGLAADDTARERLARHGMRPLLTGPALAELRRALAGDQPAVMIADIDWTTYLQVFTSRRPSALLAGLVETAADAPASGTQTELTARLARLSEVDQLRVLVDVVRAEAAAVLGHDSPAELNERRAFRDLGFDSLGAIELRRRLGKLTGRPLSNTMVFDHPTPEALAKYVRAEISGARDGVTGPVAAIAADEPIAIVGLSCRYPGGITDPEQLWRLVADGVDAISGFPPERGWPEAAIYDPDPDNPTTTYTTQGGFLTDPDAFDPAFFGISPREALGMDPQQRLLLEVTWEAFERAGLDPQALRGTLTGTYVGSSYTEYGAGQEVDGQVVTGTIPSILSGRVAYVLGLEGPAVTVDTACSSSLVAIHLAAQALRNGETTLAVAGGVTVMPNPGPWIAFSRQRALAADGRSKAFSDEADGMVLAEGIGMLVLQRLSDARRDGRPVLAVLKGSAINSDGASNGLTAPNGPSQERVIRQALANARLTADDVDVVEAHGTGTALGDPIEAQALQRTYGLERSPEQPLWLGSIKSNIGHSQSAAGVAGVIKMIMAMRYGQLPKTLHVDTLSTHVDWSASAVTPLAEPVEWERRDRPRRAAVSSFGISGTNAHVILEQDDTPSAPATVPVTPPAAVPLALAAKSENALRGQAEQLSTVDASALDLGYSLVTSRSTFDHRAVLITGADGHEDLVRSLADGESAPGVVSGVADIDGRTLFVFPGQGAQWLGMGAKLLDESPVFAARMAECAAALDPFIDFSLLDLVRGAPDAPSLELVDVVQPASFAVMVSLAALWQSYGVRPDAVLGHSQGEIAAAVVSGALSLPDGARVVALRSQAIRRRMGGSGGMMSVALSAEEILPRLGEHLHLAALNSPRSVVVCGIPAALDALGEQLAAEEIRFRRVAVDYASHSPHVANLSADLLTDLAPIQPRESEIPFYSTVTGDWLDTTGMDAEYWYTNLREQVGFAPAVRALIEAGYRRFIEASSHPVLTMAVQETADELGKQIVVTGTLRREDGGLDRALTSVAEAFVRGVEVDWTAAFAGTGARRVDLPTYAFQHDSFWLAPIMPTTEAGASDDAAWAALEAADPAELAADFGVDPASLASVLPALTDWRRRRGQAATVDSWRYRARWVPQKIGRKNELSGTWLLVTTGAEDPLAAQIAEVLAGQGVEVQRLDNPGTNRDEIAARLGTDPVAGVLSTLALDETLVPELSALPQGLSATLALTQALGAAGVEAPLWLLTRGALAIGGSDQVSNPVQAMVSGFGWTAALEHADRFGGVLDLPAELASTDHNAVVAALSGELAEDQLAVRGGSLYARRVVPAAPANGQHRWTPRGTAIITGGSGTLAPHVARWAVEQGLEHLVLLSRGGAEHPRSIALLNELAELGIEAEAAACDVTDKAALIALRDRLISQGRSIRTVIHAAAIIELASIEETNPVDFDRVLAAKVTGAANLDEVFAQTDLDRFVLFSSVAGLWGTGRHAAYVAGNAYLHALAERRRAQGRAATAVFWGIWADDKELGRVDPSQIVRSGLTFMEPALALTGLRAALDADETAVAVADVDWATYYPVYTAARATTLFDEIPAIQQPQAETVTAGPAAGGELATTLLALAPSQREQKLLELVRAEAATVLGHKSGDALPDHRAFREAGFDSVMAVDLRNRLARATGLTLPATLVFEHTNPTALVAFLLGELLGNAPATPSTATTSVAVDDEPIAIVGMACRYPGGANTPEGLWQLAVDGVDAISGLPTDRGWITDGFADAQGGFLHEAADFDPGFFGVSPREAVAMDPQQRLLLETAWEAFERSGLDPHGLRGSRTGTFIGASYTDYNVAAAAAVQSESDAADVAGHLVTGALPSIISGRINYLFGFEGPSLTLDTACSSSLMAIHLAARSLKTGESSLALAGGVAIMSTPNSFIGFSRQQVLAHDGRCKAYADSADGMTLAEGVGLVLLERLSDAQRNGHQVLAVLRGSAANSDGASNGLTAPSGAAQQQVIVDALAAAQISPAEVDAVEGHGTGTALGDPIEARALLATYGQDRERPLLLGSVKSNIGHTQMASGVASVIKMVQALQHGVLPRTLHADTPSTHVDWTAGSIDLLHEQTDWPETGRPRRAGVSSFGLSGTNVHMVLEQAPAQPEEAAADQLDGPLPVLVSARNPRALQAQAARLLSTVDGDPALTVTDLAAATATGRAVFEHRAALVAADLDELRQGLIELSEGRPAPGLVTGRARRDRTAFLFTGQGSQRAGMGAELYQRFEVFADALDEVAAHLDTELDRPLREVLFAAPDSPEAELLHRTGFAQPALFAVEVALYRLLTSWGITPDYVTGHSIGELVAAHVAEVLSLADACTLVAARARLMDALPDGGAMTAVEATEAEFLALERDRVSIASINGPRSLVVSGDADAVDEVAEHFKGLGRRISRLKVSHAFHSPHLDPMLAEFAAVARTLTYRAPRLAVVSNLTGTLATAEQLCSPEYWVQHARQAVRFADGIAYLAEQGVANFVELGPDGVLSGLAEGCLPEDFDALRIPLLRKGRPEVPATLSAISALHVHGVSVDWAAFFTGSGARRVELPTYAFQRERYWPSAPAVTRQSTVDDLRYRVDWRKLAEVPAPAPEGRWLVLAGEGEPEWLPGLLDLVAESAERVTVSDRADLAGLADSPVRGVLLLTVPSLPQTALSLQALTDAGITAPVWCLTHDADTDPEQAAVWGFGRVAALEYPDTWGGLADLPAEVDADVLARLAAVVTSGFGAEDQVAVRPEGVLGRRLVRAANAAEGQYQPSGTVLVTGATGGIGGHLARWLAREGAAHLVLASRRGGEAPGAQELVAELTELGVQVTVAACDVADRDALAALLAEHPPNAVFHAAGVVEDGVIDSLGPDAFDRVLAAKALSARHLHELTTDLDAFVLFTSTAGVIGGAGQANYAAANAYLDALAQTRRNAGIPATAVAWGPWAGAGMAAEAGTERMRRAGLFPLAASRGIGALAKAIGGEATLTVADVDWSRFAPALAAARPMPLLAELHVAPVATAEPEAQHGSKLRTELEGLSGPARARRMAELVRGQVAMVLGHSGIDTVDVELPFRDLGFDSLTTLELRNGLATATGLKLTASLVYDHPTPRELAAFLISELLGSATAAPVQVAARNDEPIAVVGIGCRFPGGISSPEELWDLLVQGRDGIVDFPADRGWDLELLAAAGSATTRGGFLPGVADFDAPFFGISPREAMAMDPQQRLLLETAWEALERAGVDPNSLRGSNAGVFVGTNGQDYLTLLGQAADMERLGGHVATGNTASVMSGRLAYTFGLEGPAITIDTACSASLVALHWAGRALRDGECSLALVGGVSVMSTPGSFIEFSKSGGLAADGRCKPFGAGADGTSWSEGAGMLVLERLSDARRNGRQVLAVIKGSAINSDGASNGLTAPNGPAQQRVIRAALADAGLRPSEVDAVEAHGTGTTLGDPIEAQALLAAYGQDRPEPLLLGSVKSNLGHTQGAAGVAGVIKMVLAVRNGVLPKTLGADEPSPHVDWSAGSLALNTENTEWPVIDRPRRAGVSAFGISGTNAHVIIEGIPAEPEVPSQPEPTVVPWLIGAGSAAAITAQIDRITAYANGNPEQSRADIGLALATQRAALRHRAVLLSTPDGLIEVARDTAAAPGETAFLFTGQGSQRLGMGQTLHQRYPVFAAALDEVLAEFDTVLDQPLREVLWGTDPAALTSTDMAQPALFAIEVALFRLLESWGVSPAFVTGHSIGELAAAHVAGVFSLSDACALVAARGRLMAALPAGGAMVAVEAAEDEVTDLVNGRVSVAAVNSPGSVVLSGEADAVHNVAAKLAGMGRRTTTMQVSHAFHSALMDPMLDDLRAVAAKVSYQEPSIPVISGLTGQLASTEQLCSPDYWVRQAREAVRFADAVRTLHDLGTRTFVEVGPHGVLTPMAEQSLPQRAALVTPVLRGDRDEQQTLLTALGRLHAHGASVDWPAFFGPRTATVNLPTYAFQHERYWPELAAPAPAAQSQADGDFWSAVEQGDLASLASSLELDEQALAAVLPALSTWRRKQREQQAAKSWTYQIGWTPLPAAAGVALQGKWAALVPADWAQDEWTTAVITALGEAVTPVEYTGPDSLPAGVSGIVSLLTEQWPEAVAAEVQAPLWWLTRQAVTVTDNDAEPVAAQAARWGAGRVAALEQPEHWGGLIDLPEPFTPNLTEPLLAALTGAEDQIAIRSTGAHARRLTRAQLGDGVWTPSGTVLVVDAHGGALARQLAEAGAAHVVLVGAEIDAQLSADLAGRGVGLTQLAGNPGNRETLEVALESVPADQPLTAAVVSVAATASTVDDAVAPAAALDELLRDTELDALVFSAPISATWGAAGRAVEAAAGAHLEALAARRRHRGLAATAVTWGAWRGGEDSDLLRHLEANGLLAVDPLAAVTALRGLVAADRPSVVVAEVDWSKFAPAFTAKRASRLLTGVPEARTALAEAERESRDTASAAAELRDRLAELPAEERLAVLVELVRERAANVLGLAGAHLVEADRAFRELGFESLTAVDLRNQLGAATGLELPVTLAFDHPTPVELAEHLLAELLGDPDEDPDEYPPPAEAGEHHEAGEIDGLDVDDLVRLALGASADEEGPRA